MGFESRRMAALRIASELGLSDSNRKPEHAILGAEIADWRLRDSALLMNNMGPSIVPPESPAGFIYSDKTPIPPHVVDKVALTVAGINDKLKS